MWRTTPITRREELGTRRDDFPPPLPPGLGGDVIQPHEQGVGPLFRRRYVVHVAGPRLSPEELMAELRRNLNAVAPTEFARFLKVDGDGELRQGDDYVVRMPGPWDGPVRAVEVTPTSFRLATLDGHLEAGQIEFRAAGADELTFTIESWARSSDRVSNALYHHLKMAKETQLHMWISVLERVVDLSGGRRRGRVEIETRRVEAVDERLLGNPAAHAALDALHSRSLNFELDGPEPRQDGGGWEVDDYCQELPPEAPGEPIPGGSWDTARRLMQDYEFADPSIVRAVYHPDSPLEGRDMLLELRFWGLRFHAGVRVAGVRDETRTVDGRGVRLFGWSYVTLQKHLEMGRMDYEVWKWLDSGEVEFRIHRFSRPAAIPNPIVRLGFRLFGRRKQVEFAERACERMAALTAVELRNGDGSDSDVARAADALPVEPASAAP